jgi:hypothetical protein
MAINTKIWNTAEVPAGGNLNESLLIGASINQIRIEKLQITPSASGGSSIYEAYYSSDFSAPLAYASRANSLSPFYDPVKRDVNGNLSNQGPGGLFYYRDEDSTGKLHLKISNQAAVGRTYEVKIWYLVPTDPAHTHDDRYFTESEITTLLAGKSDSTHNHDSAYASLSHDHDDRYYTGVEMDILLSSKSSVGHDHDGVYAAVSHEHDSRYYTETEVNSLLAGKSDAAHNHDSAYAAIGHDHDGIYAALTHSHDDRYYTETEVNTFLAGKSDTSHDHSGVYALSSHNHDDRYYTETEINARKLLDLADVHSTVPTDGQVPTWNETQGYYEPATPSGGGAVSSIIAGSGIGVSGATGDVTVSHEDTSSQGSVDNSYGNVIQDISLDAFGHISGLASVNLDGRYYTETEVNSLLNGKADVSGEQFTGQVDFWRDPDGLPMRVNRKYNGVLIDLRVGGSGSGSISVSGSTVSYNAFIGSHYTQLKDGQAEPPLGGVLISAGEIIPCSGSREEHIPIDKADAFETVEKKSTAELKADCFEKGGKFLKKIMSAAPTPETEYFTYVDGTEKSGDSRVYGVWHGKTKENTEGMLFGEDAKPLYLVTQVGLFKIRVTDANGNINNGDYLETSSRRYEAQKQTNPARLNSTIAKAMVDVTWANEKKDPALGYKWKLIPCTF